jgi:hypothetical protein
LTPEERLALLELGFTCPVPHLFMDVYGLLTITWDQRMANTTNVTELQYGIVTVDTESG